MRDGLALRLFEQWQANSSPDWPWPEDVLTYENARLPQALMLAGRHMERADLVATGLTALEWLLKVQTSPGGHLSLIGSSGWWRHGGPRARFDQQPVEAQGLVEACVEAFKLTGRRIWLAEARRGTWWDAGKIGLSPPPIETEDGWLVIYHGVRHTAAGCLYRLGLALLHRDDPVRCLLRGDEWVFGPETPYERVGDVWDVVFPCGYTLSPDGDTLSLYYGAADTTLALATGSVRELLAWLREHGRPGGMARDL